jgi:hypothetical protein
VDLFFIHATLGTAVLSWWFLTKKKAVLKDFGWGMLGYTLGLAAWTAVVLIRPTDLKPLILVGVVPFLLGSLAYAKAASDKFPVKASTLIWLVAVLIAATFIARTFFYPSDPYFSSKGLLFFGLKPVPIALYIATLSVSFLPAIRAAASAIKDKAMKSVMGIGLMVLYINAIILVSANDNTLLLINGVVLSLALLMLWVKALSSPATT